MTDLSTADHLEIQDLYARYAYAYDGGDAEGWASLFTPEGMFGRAGDEPVRGAAALARFAIENLAANPGVTHHTTNVLIEADRTGIRGRAYVLVLRVATDGSVRLRNVGEYEDRIEHTHAGWRFASRLFRSRLPDGSVDSVLITGP